MKSGIGCCFSATIAVGRLSYHPRAPLTEHSSLAPRFGGRLGPTSAGPFSCVALLESRVGPVLPQNRPAPTGHYHSQNRPIWVNNGQHPISKKNILRTENKQCTLLLPAGPAAAFVV